MIFRLFKRIKNLERDVERLESEIREVKYREVWKVNEKLEFLTDYLGLAITNPPPNCTPQFVMIKKEKAE